MTAAWLSGVRRVRRAPAVLLGVWLATFLVGLPLALVLRGMIAQHLGRSVVGGSAAAGVDYDWMQEFADQASGVGVTFKPTIIGFGAVLDNLSAFLDGTARPVVVAGAAAAYIGAWVFMAGGIIDRFARDRPTRAHGFFAASATHFSRFLRLGIVQWIVYGTLFGSVHPLLFGWIFPRLTRETTVERNAFLLRVALYVVFAALVGYCNLVFDYAKVRAVVEDRRSALGSLGGALRFVHRHPSAFGLYAVNVAVFALIVGAYALVAPGAGRSGAAMWTGFAIGQLYIAARLWAKLVFWASETGLFQSRLAHAGYVAAPPARWPDSPADEAIGA
jgi:hypothetical protein